MKRQSGFLNLCLHSNSHFVALRYNTGEFYSPSPRKSVSVAVAKRVLFVLRCIRLTSEYNCWGQYHDYFNLYKKSMYYVNENATRLFFPRAEHFQSRSVLLSMVCQTSSSVSYLIVYIMSLWEHFWENCFKELFQTYAYQEAYLRRKHIFVAGSMDTTSGSVQS